MLKRFKLLLLVIISIVLVGYVYAHLPQDANTPSNSLPSHNSFFKWLGALDGGREVIVVPGLPHGIVQPPVFRVDMKSGKSLRLPISFVGDAAIVVENGTPAVLFSACRTDFLTTSLHLYVPGSTRIREVAIVKTGGLEHLVVSGTHQIVAGCVISSNDELRILNAQTERMQGKKTILPTVSPHLYIHSISTQSGKQFDMVGFPLSWDKDGKTLFYQAANGIYAMNIGSGVSKLISYRTDIKYAYWSNALNSLVVVASDKKEMRVEQVDLCFSVVRQIYKTDEIIEPIISPSGNYLAFRNRGKCTVLHLLNGREVSSNVIGDLGPAWADDHTLIFGSTDGHLFVLGLNGDVLRQIQVKMKKDIE